MIRLDSYLDSIISTTSSNKSVVLGEPISIQKIVEYSNKLTDIRLIVNRLDDIWKKRIKLNKKDIEVQSPEYKQEVFKLIYKLNSLQILLKQKQAINEYIVALSSYLKYLKVAIFRKDKETTNRIVHKFLSDKLNLTYLTSQIDEFKENLDEYEDAYNRLMIKLSEINTVLEFKLQNVFSPKYPKLFKDMHYSYKRQKYLVYHIGKTFVNKVNSSFSKKEIAQLMKANIR